jgi:uncharacterized protein (TIGR00255 family)
MAIASMTGFGRGEASADGMKIVVELSTVNRKQFDCTFSLPRELGSLESKLHALVHAHVTRGYVKGLVTVTAAEAGAADGGLINLSQVEAQVDALRAAAGKLGLPDDLTASALLRLPELFRPRMLPDDPLEAWPLIERAARAALQSLVELRTCEGAALERDLRKRFAALEQVSEAIARAAPAVPQAYQATLGRRLSELLSPGVVLDEALVAREVAVFADRCDVSEELTRLASHFAQVTKVLAAGGACGRTLDFVCQELFREINTTGSKANDAEISKWVIAFKAGLEAVREQVQNVE